MRNLITLLFVLMAFAFGCSKKTTPAATVKPSPAAEMAENAPPPSVDDSKVNELTASGKSIYLAKCGRCHALEKPENYTRQRWVRIVDEMAPKAGLNATEKIDVLMYVQAFAKK